MSLSYAVGVRGADHLRSNMYSYESKGISDRFAVSGKAAFTKKIEDKVSVVDSLIICTFVRDFYEWDDFAKMFTYATGLEMTVSELQNAGAGIIDKARSFSVREGISRKDDTLPRVFYDTPLQVGGSRTHVLSREDMERMLDEYYQLREWDKNGIPLRDY